MKGIHFKSNHKEDKPVKYIAYGENKKSYEITLHPEKGIKVNSHQMDIELTEGDDGFFYLKWKNRKHIAEIIEKKQNKYTVLINGVSYQFSIETPTSFKRKKVLEKHEEKSSHEPIVAPMPGKIVEILVDENAEIKPGDPIFILEAMKMQNEIHSHIGGKISKINVQNNDNVDKGDALLEIET